jgi:hypothetical protein
MQLVLALVGLGGLAQDLGDFLVELGQGAVGLVGGVAGHLGAVQGDHVQADQPHCRTEFERGDQEPGQRVLVADPEPGDGHVIGIGVAGQDAEGDVFVAAAFDLAGGTDAGAVGVQQHAEQHLGVVGSRTVAIGPIGGEERVQVELIDHVQDEPEQADRITCRIHTQGASGTDPVHAQLVR